MTHTPGPWTVKTYTSWSDLVVYANYDLGQWPICALNKRATDKHSNHPKIEGPMQLANARLIASAPDLLAALQGIIDLATASDYETEKMEALSYARAALAKATGDMR